MPLPEKLTFVSIPRTMAVYCENCDTVSVAVAVAARCGVCGSIATLPLSRFVKAATAEPASARSLQVA